ncbi:MAG: DUF3887 domain-containing protein [Frankia sp.]|nr:DUF3887 domain-containing protein [Frankia sp.]
MIDVDIEAEVRRGLHARLDPVAAPAHLGSAARDTVHRVRTQRLAGAAAAALAVGAVAIGAYQLPRGGAPATLGPIPSLPTSAGQSTNSNGGPVRALADVRAVTRADFAALRTHMTPSAHALLTEDELAALWRGVTASRGSFQVISVFVPVPNGPGMRVTADLRMAKGPAYLRIDYTADGLIEAFVLSTEPDVQLDVAASDLGRHARQLVAKLAVRDYAAVRRDFDPTMRRELTAAKLRAGWDEVVRTQGRFVRLDGQTERDIGDVHVVRVLCVFERGLVEARVSYDSHARVAGLYLLPV